MQLGKVELGHHKNVNTWTMMVLENIKRRLTASIEHYKDMATIKHLSEEIFALDYAIAVIKEVDNVDK